MDPKRIQDQAADLHTTLITTRRHLHQHPELSYEEVQTGRYIADRLHSLGIPHQHGIAENGVVALLKGEKGPGPVLALRADMDALPITEANEVSYRSQNVGVMHACGHDVHTTSLLGAAQILWSLRAQWSGTLKLIFQPAEEKAPGGASIMIQEGVLQNPAPRAIFGQHVHPPLQVGSVGMRPGLYMASTDELFLTIYGKGGHGALPQYTVDPIAIAAQVITALQQLVSRQADPTLPSVLTFGHIASDGGTNNVIPNAVRLKGTFRTMDEAWRAEALHRAQQIATGIAAALGGRAELEVIRGYPFLKNDPDLTARAFAYATTYLGPDQVTELPKRMTGEDFAFYSHHIPACFYRLGTGNPARGITSHIHTDTFDVDEDCLPIGAGLLAWMALAELEEGGECKTAKCKM